MKSRRSTTFTPCDYNLSCDDNVLHTTLPAEHNIKKCGAPHLACGALRALHASKRLDHLERLVNLNPSSTSKRLDHLNHLERLDLNPKPTKTTSTIRTCDAPQAPQAPRTPRAMSRTIGGQIADDGTATLDTDDCTIEGQIVDNDNMSKF